MTAAPDFSAQWSRFRRHRTVFWCLFYTWPFGGLLVSHVARRITHADLVEVFFRFVLPFWLPIMVLQLVYARRLRCPRCRQQLYELTFRGPDRCPRCGLSEDGAID